MDKIIELLEQAGYVRDGQTRTDTFKLVTQNSYPLAGAIVSLGGRQRFALPDTPKRATVGKRTTSLYEVIDHKSVNFQNFKTSDVAAIDQAIKELTK